MRRPWPAQQQYSFSSPHAVRAEPSSMSTKVSKSYSRPRSRHDAESGQRQCDRRYVKRISDPLSSVRRPSSGARARDRFWPIFRIPHCLLFMRSGMREAVPPTWGEPTDSVSAPKKLFDKRSPYRLRQKGAVGSILRLTPNPYPLTPSLSRPPAGNPLRATAACGTGACAPCPRASRAGRPCRCRAAAAAAGTRARNARALRAAATPAGPA